MAKLFRSTPRNLFRHIIFSIKRLYVTKYQQIFLSQYKKEGLGFQYRETKSAKSRQQEMRKELTALYARERNVNKQVSP